MAVSLIFLLVSRQEYPAQIEDFDGDELPSSSNLPKILK